MGSLRKTALIGGALYVLTFASSIPAALLLRSSVLNNPDFIVGPGPDTAVLLACFLDVINALAAIGTAVVLFPVVKRQNEAVALGFIGSRVLEAADHHDRRGEPAGGGDPAPGTGRSCRSG